MAMQEWKKYRFVGDADQLITWVERCYKSRRHPGPFSEFGIGSISATWKGEPCDVMNMISVRYGLRKLETGEILTQPQLHKRIPWGSYSSWRISGDILAQSGQFVEVFE